jgi:hypothetical protein
VFVVSFCLYTVPVKNVDYIIQWCSNSKCRRNHLIPMIDIFYLLSASDMSLTVFISFFSEDPIAMKAWYCIIVPILMVKSLGYRDWLICSRQNPGHELKEVLSSVPHSILILSQFD